MEHRMESKIISIIERGRELKDKIGRIVTRCGGYPNDNKSLILLAYHSMVVEHHTAIHLLIQNNLYGSAFALVRAIYELVYRAHWVNACAAEKQINRAIKGQDIFPKMDEIVKDIDSAYGTGNFWQMIKSNSWSAMNDYTHAGIRQIGRRFKEDEVLPNYDSGELVEVLNGTNIALLLMTFFFLNVLRRTEGIKEIEQMIMEYSNVNEQTPGA
jgi:hypothetical protein